MRRRKANLTDASGASESSCNQIATSKSSSHKKKRGSIEVGGHSDTSDSTDPDGVPLTIHVKNKRKGVWRRLLGWTKA